jgi:spermidine synthase
MKHFGNRNSSGILGSSKTRLFTIGFVSILGQVVLLRELSVAFYGVELIYTLAIGVWLIFSGLGTILGIRQKNPSPVRINLLFFILSIAIPSGIVFIRSIRIIFSGTPGAYLPLHIQFIAMALSLLPFGLFLGLLFRWAARAFIQEGKSIAAAYALESLGGIAGGICATVFLKFGLQNFFIGLLCALVTAGLAFPAKNGLGYRLLRPAAPVLAVIWILCLWNASTLDRFMTSWTHPNLVATRDSPYSRITVTRLERQVAVFENDTLLFDSEGIQAEEFVHLSALQHPDPESVLVLGGGVEGILAELQLYTPRAIDYVELNPVLLEITRTQLPRQIRNSLEAENVRVIIDEPRRFLKTAPEYDLILIGMPEPSSGQANRFYTLEFFQQCAVKLKQNGILAFRLPAPDNYLSPQMILRMASVFFAAKSVFSQVMVLPGMNRIFLCSAGGLTDDPSLLVSRLHSRNFSLKMVTDSYLQYLYTNNRFREIAASLESAKAPVNTDAKPICYQYTLMIWLSKFVPALSQWDFSFSDASKKRMLYIAWFLIIAVPVALLYRTRWKRRRVFLTGVAGFAGMVLETVLLLRFQIKNGILFQDVGILLTSFMIGLVLGACAMGDGRKPLSRWIGAGIFTGFLLLSGFTGLAMRSDYSASLPATFLLLLLTGFLVAGAFSYAGLRQPADQGKAVAPLYAADLIGGGLGSLLASFIFVPVAGLSVSVVLLIPLAALSLLLVHEGT